MKNQNNQLQQSILPVTIAIIFLLGAFNSTFAQKGIGEKFGARDPRTCADRTEPKIGAITAAKAAEYATCEIEGLVGESLFFVDTISVEVGKGRPYNRNEDINFAGIDIKSPIYPIRGSFKSYQCSRIYSDKTNTNRNCTYADSPNAKGACYRRDFGEWRCMLADFNGYAMIEENVPPPENAKQKPMTDGEKKTNANNPTQNTEPQTEAKGDKTTLAKTGLPAPDFSEMEDWFEIVRFEYPKAPDRMMWIYFKPKVDIGKRVSMFNIEFRDKDGILVQSAESAYMSSYEMDDTATGTVGKVKAQVPFDSLWKQVTSVKVVRQK